MKKFSKKSIACFYIALTSFFLGGCHKDTTPSVTTKLVTDGLSINDKTYNASAWEGILHFYGDIVGDEKNFGTLYDVVICNDSARYNSDLRAVSEENLDLLILTSFTFAGALRGVAPIYPNQKYLTIDGFELPNANVLNYLFATEEGSYLVGALAALQAKAEGVSKPSFGFIGGIESDLITDFEAGYVLGIRSVFPDAEIYDCYVDDWMRPDRAAAKAKVWYDRGLYAIYTAAGMSGNGTIAEAIAHRKAGKNVWAIGVDKDQYEEGIYGVGKSSVLTSMVKRIDNAVEMGLRTVQSGTFKGGSLVLTLKDDAVGFTTTNAELDSEVIKQVSLLKNDIITGKIKIPASYKDREATEKVMQSVIREKMISGDEK